jgi:hypothetical protein
LHGRGPPVKLPTPSIAARLYAIFALMAATTVALSVYAVSNARFHAALTEEFESANAGSWNVERGIYICRPMWPMPRLRAMIAIPASASAMALQA